MTYTEAVRVCWRKARTLDGRAGRREYWWWQAFVVLACTASLGLSVLPGPTGWLALIGLLSLVPASLTVQVRRLHDIGASGWWLLTGLIPLLGSLWLLAFSLQPSREDDNPYGPSADTAQELGQHADLYA